MLAEQGNRKQLKVQLRINFTYSSLGTRAYH